MSPFGLARAVGYYGANKFFTRYANNRLKLETEEEKENVKEVLLQINMRKVSSETAITMIL